MSLERKGFVGLFDEILNQEHIEELVVLWLEEYGSVEQTIGSGGQVLTQIVRSISDIVWEENLQFRVISGEQFAWIYMTQNYFVIETSGLFSSSSSLLCRDVLVVPGCSEIIDENNDKRLDELEAQGLM